MKTCSKQMYYFSPEHVTEASMSLTCVSLTCSHES